MRKLMFAFACAASAAVFADTLSNSTTFESYVIGTGSGENNGAVVGFTDTGTATANGMWQYAAATTDDESAVTLNGQDTRPAPSDSSSTKYLELATNGAELQRKVKADGSAQAVGSGIYIDTMVQFTATPDAPDFSSDTTAKLAIWLEGDEGSYALKALGGVYSLASDDAEYLTVTRQAYQVAGTYLPETWYRLTVKAISTIKEGEKYPGFQIYIDGTLKATTAECYGTGVMAWLKDTSFEGVTPITAAVEGLLTDRTFIPSADVNAPSAQGVATLTTVGFQGSGAIDDLVITDDDLFPAGVSFTLEWPAGITPVSYTIGSDEAVSLTGATSPMNLTGIANGATVAFTFTNADGATKTLSGTAGTDLGLDAADATFTWADYLGDAVNGAYEIDNLAELKLFQKGIAITTNELKLATAGETFKLTADIALDAAWPGIGVQNGKDIYSTAGFNAAAFQGTFDGQNHTISGFQMIGKGDKAEGLDYCGFFNSAYGATIQNLKIAYAGSLFAADTTASTKESGATFVGVAKNSTLRNLTTVAGTVSCSKGFGGIVGYLTSGTLVDSCTNNVNMTSLAPNKCGGIAMITQNGSAVTIINCQNNGSVAGSGEIGSAIGYVGLDVTISNFESTVAYKMFQHQTATVTLQGTIKGNATVDSYTGNATPGLNFATVDGSVATFVADEALAAGNAYKVMHAATATYEFTAAGSISFDTNLIQAVTFAITAGEGLETPTSTTENGVVTFTAAAQSSEVPLEPGQTDGGTYDDAQAATNAAANVTVAVPAAVKNAGVDETAYKDMFEAQVVDNGNDTYGVEVGLKEAVVETLQEQVDTDAGTVAGTLTTAASEATVTTTAGLYYAIKYGSALNAMNYNTAGVLATGTSTALTVPAKGQSAAFYKVMVSPTPITAVAPAQE